jgi:hypothetical protein
MRLIDPVPAELARAIRGAALLTNAQVPAAHRLAWVGESVEAESIVYAFAQKPAGYYESTGAGAPGQAVAGLSVAWYTRLSGEKVVHLKYGVTKVNAAGAAEAPALVPPELRDQILSAGGYPVFGSERLTVCFAVVLSLKLKGQKISPECDKVLQEPGDLDAWKALADEMADEQAGAEIRKAIGAV